MLRSCGFLVLLAAIVAVSGAHASAPLTERIATSAVGADVEPVPIWDPASPQRLVRIGGALYQEDGGFYYPAEEGRITVRLADGIADWRTVVDRAVTAAPSTFAPLESLTPIRRNRLGIVDLEIPAGTDATLWCDLAFRTGLVRYAEVPTYGTYLVSPNDPMYPQQWALHNTGQSGGTPGADIHAEQAWSITGGSPTIVVGVLDSGTYIDHVDLAANIWHNPGETPNNGADDDGNGYVDDWEGWDFPHNNNDPTSTNYHGTHVAGIIAAASNNAVGIAGIAGGLGADGSRIMALEVGESGPQGSILDDAILYAADMGAQIITMSLSVSETSAINDALDYAYNTKDVFIDCAAGNSGSSVAYPARTPNVMAVASTDNNDNRSSFSNPGPELEVAAPGSNILSTQLNNSYGTSSGTSFSAPQVAGVAALIRSVNPGIPAPEVRQILIDSADDVESPGFDTLTGWGRINAFQALSLVATSDGTVRLDAGLYSCDDTLRITVSDIDLVGAGSVAVTVSSGLEPGGESIVLPENGSTGIFSADVSTSAEAAAPDGAIQVAHADTIVVEYVDANDGQGGTNVTKSATAQTDCLPPAIGSVEIVGIDNDSATVTWSTDEPATSIARFGTTVPPTQTVSSSALVQSHAVALSGLAECTIYKVEVESADGLDNRTTDDDGGSFYTFETYGNFPGVGIAPCRRGQVTLDRSAYACEDSVIVSVTDADLGSDPGTVETIQVLVTSTSEPTGEWLTLTELGPDSTGFEGTIPITSTVAATSGDGSLTVSPDDLVTATYLDANDGEGNTRSATATSVADCAGPRIADVSVTSVSSTRAVIQWTTDEPSTSRVEYGPDASLGSVAEDLLPRTVHSLAISAFDACDRVWFRVMGTDAQGNVRASDAAGQPFAFDLKQIGGVLFHDNFEVDDGWLLQGEWTRGAPEGLGSAAGDPDAAYSGTGIIGNDLTGLGAFPGDYEPAAKYWAVSPVLNATGASNLELILKRKLGLASGDVATISVFAPAENQIWSSPGLIADDDWNEVRYGIAAEADGQSSVRIGFLIDSEGPGQSFGWNIDEVIVKDATQPDYVTCGGCAGAPTFAGLTSVTDADPCGPGGLTLAWEAAPAWGTGGGGSYDVYRGDTPDFVPGAGNRIAVGVTGTTWTDATAPVDTPVWYVVRARDDESCGGGEGIAEDNLVRLSGTETIDRPVPGSVGDSLRAFRVGVAHVRLSWDPVPGAAAYRVRRSDRADFGGAQTVGDPEIELLEDQDAAADPTFFTYRVTALNACGQEGP